MEFAHWTLAILLATSLTQALWIPTRNQQQRAERDLAVSANVDTAVEVHLSDFATLEELAEELIINFRCLLDANPLLSTLHAGDHCIVPYSCCGTSCKGKFCSKRPQCHGHSTSSAPAQTAGTTTTCVTTITTSIPTTLSTSTSITVVPPASSSTSIVTLTSSSTATISPASSTAVVPPASSSSVPPGSSSIPPGSSSITPGSSTTTLGSFTIPGIVTTTNSLGQTVISDSSGAVTLTTGISTASVVTLPDGSIVTFQPSTTTPGSSSPPTTVPGVVTTTNSLGQTVISDSSGAVTLSTGISTASVVTLPDGSVVTFQPSTTATGSSSPPTTISGVVTTTNSLGQTVISDSSGAVTLPTGISTASVVTLLDSSIVTFQPTTQATSSSSLPGILTTTDPAGETVISSSGEQFTIPTAATTPITLTNGDGSIFTFSPTVSPPPGSPSPISSSGPPGVITTTDPAGGTVISSSGEGFTIPTAVTTPITLTNGDGSVFTFSPTVSPPPGSSSPTSSSGPPGIITTTDPAGETVISSSGEGFTIPTAVTTPITVTNGEGSVFTFSPTGPPSSSSTSSSTILIGGIFPVTTSVPAPKATNGGTEIPCNLWFFDLCIQFGDISIGGWEFNLPTGVRPPGPPPGITFPPSLSISVSISGTLPPWPSVTIGPDNLPTYEPKPTDGPDDGCKTESAEVCLTSTSFGVDTATVTTTSSVLSTCATIFGCDVTDSASSTATTSTASSSDYPYSCTLGCTACVAKRGLTTATAAPPLPTTDTKKAKDLFSYARNLTLAERDIPSEANADGIAEFYSEVAGASDTTVVSEDNVGQTEISSSRFKYFDNSELNILVEGLRGCTSVVVVSRLGVYVSHLWEPYFGVNPSYNFQTGVVNYLNTGRDSGLTGGVTENGVTESLTVLVQGGVFGDTATTKIFIMTPATFDLDLTAGVSSADQRASLTNGDFQPLFDGSTATPQGVTLPDRLTPIKTQLGQLMPGVPISQFTYRRQTIDRFLSSDGYGKATVVYSNNQKEDPNTFEPIGPPQQAIWQCWMQGKLMGSDQWDALPGQTGSCPANQKRQAGSLCSSPTTSPGTPTSVPPTTSISSTSVPPSSSIPASTPNTVTITPTPSGSSSPPLSNLPTLTTAQSTPAGETCVSTATSTQCALGPNPSETACVTNTYCASFAPTAVTTSSTAASTPTGQVYIDIYTDSNCINVLERTILNAIGQCYSPTDSKGNPITFACFALTYISTAASNSADLIAYKDGDCFAQFDTDSQTYPNLTSIQYQNEKPFTLGSLSLGSAGK